MLRLQILASVLLLACTNVEAGCIGPVVLGECHGKEVPWDTSDHGTDLHHRKSDFGLPTPDRTQREAPAPSSPNLGARQKSAARFDDRNPHELKKLGPRGHPFLLITADRFQEMRDRAASEPWRSMKNDALKRSRRGVSFSGCTRNDCRRNRYNNYIGASALAYILDPDHARVHAARVKKAILTSIDAIRPGCCSWDVTVPHADAIWMSIVSLDTVYNDLTPDEIRRCETKLQERLANINPSTSFAESRLGVLGTWDVYRGTRTTPDNAYYREIFRFIGTDGPASIPPNYAYGRLAGQRLSKGGYIDVLEHTGIDRRFYKNRRYRKLFEWLGGLAVNPFNWYVLYGDARTRPHGISRESNWLMYRAGKLGRRAAENSAYFLRNAKRPGNLVTYVIPDEALPEPRVPGSEIFFSNGGAFFREPSVSPDALMGVLVNFKKPSEHSHRETNGLYLAAYGVHVLRNSGWKGIKEAYFQNCLTVGGSNHRHRSGGGIEEGFVAGGFDYACGLSGKALGDDTHRRNLLFLHPKAGKNGYFVVIDEVEADAGEHIKSYLHPNSGQNPQTIAAFEHYSAPLNLIATPGDRRLEVFYATEPTLVNLSDAPSGSEKNVADHKRMEAVYSTDGNGHRTILTVLFPSDAAHRAATMERISAPAMHGVSIDHGGGQVDYALVSTNTEEQGYAGIRFKAQAAHFGQSDDRLSHYFVKRGNLFQALSNPAVGFQSWSPVSLYMAGPAGRIISPGAEIELYYPAITGVKVNGVVTAVLDRGAGWVRVYVRNSEGEGAKVELDTSGATSSQLFLPPVADAHVSSGKATVNYGGEPRLKVNSVGKSWTSYLKFDLNGIDAEDVETATLRLYADQAVPRERLIVYSTSSRWQEGEIHFDNRPSLGDKITGFTISEPSTVELDVTAHLRSRLSADSVVSFAIYGSAGQTQASRFNSREANHNRPGLLIRLETDPDTAADAGGAEAGGSDGASMAKADGVATGYGEGVL